MPRLRLIIFCCRYIPVAAYTLPWAFLLFFGENNLKNNEIFGFVMIAVCFPTLFIGYYLVPVLLHKYDKTDILSTRWSAMFTAGLSSVYIYWKVLDPVLCAMEKQQREKKLNLQDDV